MMAAFAQFHHHVLISDFTVAVRDFDAIHRDFRVKIPWNRTEARVDFHFNFWLQFLLDDGFQTAQNERLQLCAKTCETFVRVTSVVKRRI